MTRAAVTPEDVFATVRDAVVRVLEVDPQAITRETSLRELGADSLGLMEIAEIVEERLQRFATAEFRIDDEDLEAIDTVGEAVDYALGRL